MVRFIAEICSNHNNDLSRAIKLIEVAASIGCDAVKFQLFRIDKLFHSSILNHPDYQFLQERRKWEIPLHWFHQLKETCNDHKIEFGCTPFDLDAVDFLWSYVDFYKISSYDLMRSDLLQAICNRGLPVIMSTGMATLGEVTEVVARYGEFSNRHFERLTLLHCISEYPTPIDRCNLSFIGKLNLIHSDKIKIGWSDHSANPAVINRAMNKWNTQVIEFHLDLEDGLGNEYKLGHCWLPSQAKKMIEDCRSGLEADGNWKYGVEDMRERLFRADSEDGLRPVKETRGKLC